MNHKYISIADAKRICKLALPYLKSRGWVSKEECDEKLLFLVETVKGNMDVIPDIVKVAKPFFEEIGEPAGEKEKKILSYEEVPKVFKFVIEKLKELPLKKEVLDNFLNDLKDELQIPGKKIYHPLRVALYGSKNGPELSRIIILLGKEKTIKRLEKYVKEGTE